MTSSKPKARKGQSRALRPGSASLGACNKPSDFNALPAPGVGVAVAIAAWVLGVWGGAGGVGAGAAWAKVIKLYS